jgi:MFS family permease
MSDARPPRGPLVALGVLNIVAFGSWFYGFGVLLEPIREDTGWAESTLTSTYGVSLLLTGMGAAIGGGIIDRRGGRVLFAGAAALSSTALVAASFATSELVFAGLGVLAGGTIGATGYYHATQAVIGRLAPDARTRGMTALTLWGAFASPVFLPALGRSVLGLGWRPTLRIVAAVVGLAFAIAALSLPREAPHAPAGRRTASVSTLAAIRHSARDRVVRRLYLAGLMAGFGTSLLLLYQVPAMVAAGLSLATASTLAGVRGFVQLGGRVPLPPLVRRIGSFRALRGSLVLAAVGALILPLSGQLPTAVAFTLVAGIAIGALAALEGIYTGDITDPGVLGTTLGSYSLVRGIGAAVGPVAGGFLAGTLGSRGPSLVLSAIALVIGAVLLRPATAEHAAASSGQSPADGAGP